MTAIRILIASKEPLVVSALPLYKLANTTDRTLTYPITIDRLKTQIVASDL